MPRPSSTRGSDAGPSQFFHQLAQPRYVTATDRQGLIRQPLEVQVKVPHGAALQPANTVTCHQCIAVDAYEMAAELVLKGLERLVQQQLSLAMTQGHVFVVGDKIQHILD